MGSMGVFEGNSSLPKVLFNSGGFQLDQPLRRDHLWPRTRSPSSEPPTSFAPPGKKRRKEKKRFPIKGTLATTSCGVHVHGLHTTRFGSPLLGAEAVKVCMLLERCCAPRSRVTTEDGRGVHTLSGRGRRSLKAPGRPPLACQGAELLHARLAACQDRLAVPLTCSAPDRHTSLSGNPDSGRELHRVYEATPGPLRLGSGRASCRRPTARWPGPPNAADVQEGVQSRGLRFLGRAGPETFTAIDLS